MQTINFDYNWDRNRSEDEIPQFQLEKLRVRTELGLDPNIEIKVEGNTCRTLTKLYKRFNLQLFYIV